jgi:hypothetical protein
MSAFKAALSVLISAGMSQEPAHALLQSVVDEALAPSPGALRQRRCRERKRNRNAPIQNWPEFVQ